MNRWHDIDGWLTHAEGAELQRLATGRDVLEIGAWHGRSTVAIALTARRVYTVDHFRGDGYTNGAPDVSKLLSNLTRHEVSNSVCVLIGKQRDVLPRLCSDFGLIFYDADHSGESTSYALNWIIERAPSAVIAVHDYCDVYEHYRDAKHAIDAAARQLGRSVRLIDTLAVLEQVHEVGLSLPDLRPSAGAA